jgi:hypothetical protein
MNVTMRLASIILALSLLGTGHARALAILDFINMNLDDQATYVTSLVEASAKKLRADGHPDQAQKTIGLFKDSTKKGGVNQLAVNMKSMQLTNNRNATNPNNRAPAYDVEAAMEATLRDNGINVPVSYLEGVNRDFHPVFPMRGHQFGQ